MKCPACGHKMTAKKIENVEVDICDGGCGGIWFDRFELKKFDEEHEIAGDLLSGIKKDPNAKVDSGQHPCPKCTGITMRRFFSSPKRHVEIDECGKCSGIFLNSGELFGIRSEFKTEQERKKFADDFVNGSFDNDPGIQQLKNESAEENARMEAIGKAIYRIIAPFKK